MNWNLRERPTFDFGHLVFARPFVDCGADDVNGVVGKLSQGHARPGSQIYDLFLREDWIGEKNASLACIDYVGKTQINQ